MKPKRIRKEKPSNKQLHTQLTKWTPPNTKSNITLPKDETLRVVGQVIGYSLVAASHPQGLLVGLGQLVKDRAELEEYRKTKIK